MTDRGIQLAEQMRHRRSCRNYTGEAIREEDMEKILKAALWSPTGKNKRETWFYLVRNRELIKELARCRAFGSAQLLTASAAIVVFGDEGVSDTWIEDSSLALGNMALMADALGLGACWIQCRLRETADGVSTEAFVKAALPESGIPETARPLAILALGTISEHPKPYEDLDPFASGRVFVKGDEV